jgi:hypothetical protein
MHLGINISKRATPVNVAFKANWNGHNHISCYLRRNHLADHTPISLHGENLTGDPTMATEAYTKALKWTWSPTDPFVPDTRDDHRDNDDYDNTASHNSCDNDSGRSLASSARSATRRSQGDLDRGLKRAREHNPDGHSSHTPDPDTVRVLQIASSLTLRPERRSCWRSPAWTRTSSRRPF